MNENILTIEDNEDQKGAFETMSNLMRETEEKLADNGYGWNDIASIQAGDIGMSVEHFKKLSDNYYDNGYGVQIVASDLVIIMKNGTWFRRREYDGSEWWEYLKSPKIAERIDNDQFKSLFTDGWMTMKEWTESIKGKENDK